jgi:hypothetical protein
MWQTPYSRHVRYVRRMLLVYERATLPGAPGGMPNVWASNFRIPENSRENTLHDAPGRDRLPVVKETSEHERG